MKRFLPLVVGLLTLLFVANSLRLPSNATAFDTEGFARLPVLLNGRLKPIDTVARTSLLLLQNRQPVKTPDGTSLTPSQWLLDALFRPDIADTYQTFRIDNNEVLALLRLSTDDGQGGVRFSFDQIEPQVDALEQQFERAVQIESGQRTAFEREIVKLRERLIHYIGLRFSLNLPQSDDFAATVARFEADLPRALAIVRDKQETLPENQPLLSSLADQKRAFDFLASRGRLLAIPPPPAVADINAWSSLGDSLLSSFATGVVAQPVRDYAALGRAWRTQDATSFGEAVGALHEHLTGRTDPRLPRTALEFLFNHAQPFYNASILYVLAALVAFVSWLVSPAPLARSALSIGFVAWLLTTAGIAARMYIEARPPVTNLYSSALFVGWVGAGLALLLERYFRNSIGNVVAGIIGFLTLIVAHNLSFSGDTMEMMRAVLDSNFWLSVHVVTITMGYGACFLAGVLGWIYILRGTLSRSLDGPTADALVRMVYGSICFATLFSLVGTVTGGIWADQSWGRFWGWDPKENGALVIVLWCAVILHARWGKMIGARGLMNLAIFGNNITAASWFGVNMLGVGLHSYGFMDKALVGLCAWWLLNLAIIGVGLLPLALWRSQDAARR